MVESNKKQIPWNKGKENVYSEETLSKMRKIRRKYYEEHPEVIENLSSINKGKRGSYEEQYGEEKAKEIKEKLKDSMKGKNSGQNNGMYRDGGRYLLWLNWRNSVIEREGNICKRCKKSADVCHHIYPRELFPEKQFDPDNGCMLCKGCHTWFHNRCKYQLHLSFDSENQFSPFDDAMKYVDYFRLYIGEYDGRENHKQEVFRN